MAYKLINIGLLVGSIKVGDTVRSQPWSDKAFLAVGRIPGTVAKRGNRRSVFGWANGKGEEEEEEGEEEGEEEEEKEEEEALRARGRLS